MEATFGLKGPVKEVCGLLKTKQGMVLWLHLPRDLPSNIKESFNASVGITQLTTVYRMNDAGRKCYFKVEKVLTGLGCKKARYSHRLFMYV